MKHDVAHEEKQNAALRFLAAEVSKHALVEVNRILGDDESSPAAEPVVTVDLSEVKAAP